VALSSSTGRTAVGRPDLPPASGIQTLVTLAIIVIVVAALYFGSDILVPLALAMLLSFALAPAVRWLRRRSVPNLPAVLTVVSVAFLLILAFGWILALQAMDLAQRLPTYRSNIETKVEALFESPPGGRLYERAAEMVRDLGRRIEQEREATPTQQATSVEVEEQPPLPVEIQEAPLTSVEIITTVLGPLVSPLATGGIVIVFVIFMLLKREDLRDRFIRLAGSRDLPRTTDALDDAAQRVGRYLLMQLVVNVTYAIPIGVGLWLIGIPNPILWGMLCGLLRFVPYIGPVVAAFFPLALAIAVDPGWMTFLLAGAWFIVVELISNNVVEPWLYGASTGLSPIAIIAAAVFWTWLWGPIGLLLSTPLTVCLVVLGRHVPQLTFLDVILGNEPVLEPSELLYQRLLVGDPNEATERAEENLRENSLARFYDDVAIPALAIAEQDRVAGRLSEEQRVRVTEGAMVLIDNLAEWEESARPASKEEVSEDEEQSNEEEAAVVDLAEFADRPILCAGARGNLDDAAAAMLATLLERRGAEVRLLPHESMQTAQLRETDIGEPLVVVLSYMNSDSLAHARFLVRRVRRRWPETKVIVGFWASPVEDKRQRDPLAATRADRVVTSLEETIAAISEMLTGEANEGEATKESDTALPIAVRR
jgi:predicted PurR-regulated permease PerM